MDNCLTVKGQWWLPDSNERIHGTLTFTPEDGAKLALDGEFSGAFWGNQFNIILGESSEGIITLSDCFISRYSFTGKGTTILANCVFCGAHFRTKEEITFHSIVFHCSNLEEWVWNSSITVKSSSRQMVLGYCIPPDHVFCLDDAHELRIFSTADLPPEGSIPYYAATITEHSYLEIRCLEQKEEPLDQLVRLQEQLESFLTLAIGYPQQTDALYSYVKGSRVSIFMQPFYVVSAMQVLPPTMFMNFLWHKECFGERIQRWFALYSDLADVLNMYFSLLRQGKAYTHYRFLFRVQVLESYHRKRIQEKSEEVKAKKKYIRELLERVPNAQDRGFLRKQLSFAHEPTLNDRLTELFQNCVITEEILQSKTDIQSFIKNIRNTRNYLTHYDSSMEQKAVSGIALYNLSEQMDIFIRYYLFMELGFTPSECKQIFEDRYHFRMRSLQQ